MRKAAAVALLCLAACSGKGEFIPTPSPAPNPPTTAEQGLDVAPGRAEDATTTTEPEPTTTEAPPTTRRPTTTTVFVPATIRASTTTTPVSDTLASIRYCESRGNYSTDTGNGFYGAYQFTLSTWQSVGGTGNPAHASPAEQDMRAQMMINAGRRGEWPNC